MASRMEAAATWEAIDSLTPWDRNPRHNDNVVERVAHSITRFGFGSPILARSSDRVIIGGHTRYKAAQRLGMDKVPVRFLDLDPAEAAALALADNKLGELAGWDEEAVAEILGELESQGAPIDGLGWSDAELKRLLDSSELSEVMTRDAELSTEAFQDFDHQCPKCGFEWSE
jgi:ParB-like chromosome segregation protein Spo0J